MLPFLRFFSVLVQRGFRIKAGFFWLPTGFPFPFLALAGQKGGPFFGRLAFFLGRRGLSGGANCFRVHSFPNKNRCFSRVPFLLGPTTGKGLPYSGTFCLLSFSFGFPIGRRFYTFRGKFGFPKQNGPRRGNFLFLPFPFRRFLSFVKKGAEGFRCSKGEFFAPNWPLDNPGGLDFGGNRKLDWRPLNSVVHIAFISPRLPFHGGISSFLPVGE